jgi:hypothetical protein
MEDLVHSAGCPPSEIVPALVEFAVLPCTAFQGADDIC